MRLRIFIALLFVGIFVQGENNLSFKRFNTENKMLMHNSIETAARDSLGYLWVGTNYGLNKLDGYQTVNYVTIPGDSTSISNNHIKDLYVDTKGRLWVGSIGGGLNQYDYENDRFIRYQPDISENSISGFNISGITEDMDGNLWIGVIGKGISKFYPETGKFVHFGQELFEPKIQNNSNIDNIKCDREGNIWIGFGFDQQGIYKIDVKTEKLSYLPFPYYDQNSSNIGQVTDIDELKNGTLLFTLWNGGLYRYNPNFDEKISLIHHPQFFDNSHLTSIAIDQNENIWIGTWENGIFQLSNDFQLVKNLKKQEKNAYSLNSNAINYLYFEQNNLWICHRDQGIDLLSLENKMFQNLSTIDVSEFMTIDAHCFTGDAEGNIWIGSRGQGLWKYNQKTDELINYNSKDYPQLINNNILCITSGSEGLIWFGTDGSFIGSFDPVKNKFNFITYNEDAWSSVYTILDNDSVIWCGTWGAGLKMIDKKTEKYRSINFDTMDQYNNSVFDIDIIEDDLWIANIGLGLIKYNIPNQSITCLNQDSSYQHLLPYECINDIYVDRNNTIWLSTSGEGLIHFNPVNHEIHKLNKSNGLSNDVVQAMISDEKNKLWISTITGVTSFDNSKKEATTFYNHNGLIINHLNKSAAYFDKKTNRIYMGSPKGINYCSPNEIELNRITNPVIINYLSVNGKVVDSHQTSIIDCSIELAKTIHLNHHQHIFTIGFSSMEFTPSFKNTYFYRLVGFNDNWTETPYSKNSVQYTNLDPGNYIFEVKACNNDGFFYEKVSSIQIIIYPAWWQTLLFKIGMLFFISSLIILAIYSRYRQLIISKKRLEQIVQKRTAEIILQKEHIEQQKTELEIANNTKDTFFSLIGHDLKNPLSTIDQFNEILILDHKVLSQDERLSYYKLLKNTSSQTLQLLDELILWAKSQTNRIAIDKRPIPIDIILKKTFNLCESLALNKNIRLKVSQKTNSIVNADENSVETILRNLITNAIKFSNANQEIDIAVKNNHNEVIVSVKDTGIGMSEKQLSDLFKIEKIMSREGTSGEMGTGLGLILCKEFVVLNGGRIWVESEKEKGSTFYFTLEKVQENKWQ